MYTGVLPPVRVAAPPFPIRAIDFSAMPLVATPTTASSSQSSTAITYGDHHARFIPPSDGHGGSHAADATGADVGPSTAWPILGSGTPSTSPDMTSLSIPPPMAPPFHRADPPKRPDMSRIMESMLIHRVEPEYPILAAKTRTQGEVRLKAVISKEGTVEGLQVISGHPLLVAAALRAVQEWRYRPCLLNGQPIEVEASIIVRFTLAE